MSKLLIIFIGLTLAISSIAQFDPDSGTVGLNVRLLGSSANTGNDDNESTGSYSPQQGSLLMAFIINTATTPGTPTMTANGLTWDKIFDTNYLSDHKLTVWTAKCNSGCISGIATGSTAPTSQTGWTIQVIEITGTRITSTQGTNGIKQRVNANVSAGTSITVTLGALRTGNMTVCMFANNLNGTADAAESGWTELSDINFNTPATEAFIMYRKKNTDTSANVTNGSSTSGVMICLEFGQEGNFP